MRTKDQLMNDYFGISFYNDQITLDFIEIMSKVSNDLGCPEISSLLNLSPNYVETLMTIMSNKGSICDYGTSPRYIWLNGEKGKQVLKQLQEAPWEE